MNLAEAHRLLGAEVARLRAQSHAELCSRLPRGRWRNLFVGGENVAVHDVVGPSGATYRVETQVLWDDEPEGAIRVLVAIDDGGLSAHRPLTADFVLAPDGSFVGE